MGVVLIEMLYASTPPMIEISVDDSDAEAILALFDLLRLDWSDAHWIAPFLETNPWPVFELWRQDDNGNTFRMSTHTSRRKAQWLEANYEARGHKQTYWIEEKAP